MRNFARNFLLISALSAAVAVSAEKMASQPWVEMKLSEQRSWTTSSLDAMRASLESMILSSVASIPTNAAPNEVSNYISNASSDIVAAAYGRMRYGFNEKIVGTKWYIMNFGSVTNFAGTVLNPVEGSTSVYASTNGLKLVEGATTNIVVESTMETFVKGVNGFVSSLDENRVMYAGKY